MANDNNPAARYGRGAVVLHWLIALAIAANYVLAWVSEDLPKEERMALMGNHKALGIAILLLTMLRIVWRLVHKAPPLVETLKAWEAALSRVTHAALYFVMLAVPLAGWGLHSSASQGRRWACSACSISPPCRLASTSRPSACSMNCTKCLPR